MAENVKIRLATYMCPSLPVEYFETIAHYLESKLHVHATLIYESRWDGPPIDRPNPFSTNEVDIVFMNSSSYLRLVDSKNQYVGLLPVAAVHRHSKGDGKPGYFADIIVHKDLQDDTKEFLDLRGCKWAYSRPTSLSGYLITLKNLKQMGENSSFFGNLLPSGSHVNSINMIIQKKADAAAVDANALSLYLAEHPEKKSELFVLDSWGPLPPYPIVINKRLPESFQTKLANALLVMHQDPLWKKQLDRFGVVWFMRNDSLVYDTERDLIKNVKGLSLDTVYY